MTTSLAAPRGRQQAPGSDRMADVTPQAEDYRDLIHDALILLRAQNSAGWMHYARCAARLQLADDGHSHALTALLFGILSSCRMDDLELLLMGFPIEGVDRARALGHVLACPSIQDTCETVRGYPATEGRALMSLALVMLVEHLLRDAQGVQRLAGGLLVTSIRRMVVDVEGLTGLTGLSEFVERIQLLEPLSDVRFHVWVDAHLFRVRG